MSIIVTAILAIIAVIAFGVAINLFAEMISN